MGRGYFLSVFFGTTWGVFFKEGDEVFHYPICTFLIGAFTGFLYENVGFLYGFSIAASSEGEQESDASQPQHFHVFAIPRGRWRG